ncbi:hypothetical protein [Rubinisphaera margarita]|uniref:hypothetical protein n=1 Tax=Rubinisphaera margarita TaxID=2909586 RepID=UPI001EE93DF0|nr:hypothetical protein [Rubinisphaera margarita]MCG6155486.1 hypothetical protein [Rubinisphaera margarita]
MPPAQEADAVPAETRGRRRDPRFYLALGIGLVWLLILAGLSLWTANPVTVNREQLLLADAVIIAEIVEPTGEVKVSSILKGRADGDLQPESRVSIHRAGDHWNAGENRVLPLTRDANGNWTIAPAPLPDTVHLDYPATDEVLEQVDEILQRPRS